MNALGRGENVERGKRARRCDLVEGAHALHTTDKPGGNPIESTVVGLGGRAGWRAAIAVVCELVKHRQSPRGSHLEDAPGTGAPPLRRDAVEVAVGAEGQATGRV